MKMGYTQVTIKTQVTTTKTDLDNNVTVNVLSLKR